MSSGFQAAGHEIVFAAEKWSRARLVYDANFDHAATPFDLSDVVNASFSIAREQPDVIVGGPPCQDFSAAGLRTETERSNLTVCFAEIVRACRPAWFVMENVPEAGESRAWRTARARLGGSGYGITEIVLDASLCGVPQLRKRRFMIGRHNKNEGTLESIIAESQQSSHLTVRNYLGEELGLDYYYRHPRHWGRRAIYSIDEPAATVRSTNRPIPPKYTLHPLDAAAIADAKPLTSKQRSRIQTFSQEFEFDDDLFAWEMDLMVANAVPVELARFVAMAITEYERMSRVNVSETDFRKWLREVHKYTDRSAGNVVSRLKRARRMIGEATYLDWRDECHALQKMPDFLSLSASVRSQLKKAVQLHSEFLHRS
jgi:DNA (cytosine-5)-methyltransferase 1